MRDGLRILRYTPRKGIVMMKAKSVLVSVLFLTFCGCTPSLITRIEEGDVDGVKAALESGADSNERDKKGSALAHAVSANNEKIVKMLLEAKADPNTSSRMSWTYTSVLDEALSLGTKAIVKYLIEAGARPSRTALYRASKTGDIDIVKLLLAAGAIAGSDALSESASKGHIDIVKLFLAAGLGAKPGSDALSESASKRHIEIVKLLLAAGAIAGSDAVCEAASKGDVDLVKLLVASNTKASSHALCEASSRGQFDVVKVLLKAGVNVNSKCDDHQNPLVEAVVGEQVDVVDLLLSKGAKSDYRFPTMEVDRTYRLGEKEVQQHEVSGGETLYEYVTMRAEQSTGGYPSLEKSRRAFTRIAELLKKYGIK